MSNSSSPRYKQWWGQHPCIAERINWDAQTAPQTLRYSLDIQRVQKPCKARGFMVNAKDNDQNVKTKMQVGPREILVSTYCFFQEASFDFIPMSTWKSHCLWGLLSNSPSFTTHESAKLSDSETDPLSCQSDLTKPASDCHSWSARWLLLGQVHQTESKIHGKQVNISDTQIHLRHTHSHMQHPGQINPLQQDHSSSQLASQAALCPVLEL